MKKFLFTLAAVLMAISSFAQTDAKYLYVNTELCEDAGVSAGQHWYTVVISAEFPGYLNAFEAMMHVPEGLTVVDLEAGADYPIHYYNARGVAQTTSPAIAVQPDYPGHFLVACSQAAYDYVDGELVSVTAAKWGPGTYEEFIIVWCTIDDETYHGGNISITTTPSSGQDPRTTIDDLGDKSVPHTTDATEPLPDPNPVVTAPEAPVITFAGEETATMTVTVTAEEGCTLIVNGEAIESNTYTYDVNRDDIYTEGTVNVSAYAVKDGVQSEEATGSKDFVVSERPTAEKPVIDFAEIMDGDVVTAVEVVVTNATSYVIKVDGEVIDGNVIEANYEAAQEITVEATNDPGYPYYANENSGSYTLNKLNKKAVADPVFSTSMDDNNVYVTISWPANTDGNQIYTGEYTYARPEYGQADQSYDVEAYVEEGTEWQASNHVTYTVEVPAKAPVWQEVAAPVITTSMDDDYVYVTINWPTTTGDQVYTGEYTYARPEYGQPDQSYDVEAYTEADYPYSESVHATQTINVPAKEEVIPVEPKIYEKFNGTELPVGKKIIFVYENGANSYAFGPISSNKGNPVNVVVENNQVDIANTDVIEFTVGGGDVAYGTDIKQYTLEFTDGYLAYASSTNFKIMSSVGAYDSEAYWRLQAVTGGYALNNAGTASRYIRKHATSNKFGPYAVNADSEIVVIYIEKSDAPEAPNAPEITFAGEETTTMTVTVTAEEGCTLIVNGEAIESNTYTYDVNRDDIYTEGTVNVSAYAVKDGVQSEEATGSKNFVVSERPTAAEPIIDFVETKEGNIVTSVEVVVDRATSYVVYVNDEPLRGEVIAASYDEVKNIHVEATNDPGYPELANTAEGDYTLNKLVAKPVISTEVLDDVVNVTISWPTTDGEHMYTGEYTYTRGEEAQEIAVEAYTTAAGDYQESFHANETITVPALEVTPDQTPDPEINITTGKYNEKYVEITCEDPNAVIYYSIQFEDGEWSDWAVYDDKMMYVANGHYNIKAYAVNPEKEQSNTVDDDFSVSNCTAVNEINGTKTIAGVRYFNMAGQEMAQPEGMTIIVTTYTDGTSSAVKVMK